MNHDHQYFLNTSSTTTKSFPAQQKDPDYYSFKRQGSIIDNLILTFFNAISNLCKIFAVQVRKGIVARRKLEFIES